VLFAPRTIFRHEIQRVANISCRRNVAFNVSPGRGSFHQAKCRRGYDVRSAILKSGKSHMREWRTSDIGRI